MLAARLLLLFSIAASWCTPLITDLRLNSVKTSLSLYACLGSHCFALFCGSKLLRSSLFLVDEEVELGLMSAFEHSREADVEGVADYYLVLQLASLVDDLLRISWRLFRMLPFDVQFDFA